MIAASQHAADVARLVGELQAAMAAHIVKGLQFTRPVAHDEDRAVRHCYGDRVTRLGQLVREGDEDPGISKQPIVLQGEEIAARIGRGRKSMGYRPGLVKSRQRIRSEDFLKRPVRTRYLDYRRYRRAELRTLGISGPASWRRPVNNPACRP